MENKHRVVIALGSNYRQEQHINEAVTALRQLLGPLTLTDIVWTDPIGMDGSDRFLNAIAAATTALTAAALEQQLKALERRLGRSNEESRRGRIRIDLDLMAYDDRLLRRNDWQRPYIKVLYRQLQDRNIPQ